MSSHRLALIHYNWGAFKKRKLGPRHTQWEGHRDEKAAICKPEREASEKPILKHLVLQLLAS